MEMLGTMLTLDVISNDIMSDNIDVLKAENSVLKKQLQSKGEAVTILKNENNKLKLQLQEKSSQEEEKPNPLSFSTQSIRERNTLSLYKALKQKHTASIAELENIRSRYEDACEDLKILRYEIGHRAPVREKPTKASCCKEELEDILGKLEKFKVQNSKLKLDVQALLDEKEDLIDERNQLVEKNDRLHREMINLLRLEPGQTLNIDHLLMENRSLQGQISRLRDEKDLANAMGRKYREAWEKTRCAVKTDAKPGADQQQLNNLLDSVTFPVSHPVDLTQVPGLTGLAISLLETLQDRQIQMRHLRANNRDLAGKILLMENQGNVHSAPTQALLRETSITDGNDSMDFEKLTQKIQAVRSKDKENVNVENNFSREEDNSAKHNREDIFEPEERADINDQDQPQNHHEASIRLDQQLRRPIHHDDRRQPHHHDDQQHQDDQRRPGEGRLHGFDGFHVPIPDIITCTSLLQPPLNERASAAEEEEELEILDINHF